MPEEQTPYIPRPSDPPALEDDASNSPVVSLSRHRYNVLLQAERTIRKLGIQDDPDSTAQAVAERTAQVMDVLGLLIGDDTVEPKGILSRIERHIVRAFGVLDQITVDGDAHTAGLRELNERLSAGLRKLHEIANHEAQNGAARHEFLREFAVAVRKDQHEIASHEAQIGAARHEFLREFAVAVRGDYEAVLKELKEFDRKLSFLDVDAPSLRLRLEKIETASRDAHDDLCVRIAAQTNSFVERFVRLERSLDWLTSFDQRLANIERAIVAMIARS